MTKFATIAALCLALTACSKKKEEPKSGAAPTTAAAPAAAPVEAAPTKPAAAAAGTDLDLGAAGAAWAGFSMKAPAGSTATDNGAGGISVIMGNLAVEFSPLKDRDLKLLKEGLAAGLEFSKGKITYQVDTADEVAYTTETPSPDGSSTFKGYGFSFLVDASGTKVECRGTYDDPAQAQAARDACKTLTKK